MPSNVIAPADQPRPFAPDSVIWKLTRERVSLLYGPAAAILQVAHPRIAAGVFEHSAFESRPIARLHGTLEAVWSIVFGTDEQARAAARVVAARHARVRGSAAALNIPGPPTYSADEPDLLMWVIATLVMASLDAYTRCVAALSDDERRRFYADMRRFGTFFGLPETFGPQNFDDFLIYWNQMLADPALGSHPVSRRVAAAVARPPRPRWLCVAMWPIGPLVHQTLPAPVAQRLGMPHSPFSRLYLHVITRLCRLLLPLVPGRLRYPPHYRNALRSNRPNPLPASPT